MVVAADGNDWEADRRRFAPTASWVWEVKKLGVWARVYGVGSGMIGGWLAFFFLFNTYSI